MSPSEFLAMPLKLRVQFILERSLSFKCDGEPVDYRLALKSFMASTTAAS